MSENENRVDRRGFLKLAGVGAAGAGASVVAPKEAAAEAAQGAGYRETEQVKTYYASARF